MADLISSILPPLPSRSRYAYYVGKPLAVCNDELFALFFTASGGSTVVEAAGLFSHPADIGIGPNALLQARSEAAYEASPEVKLAAREVVGPLRELTAEGKVTGESTSNLKEYGSMIMRSILNASSLTKIGASRFKNTMTKLPLTDSECIRALFGEAGRN